MDVDFWTKLATLAGAVIAAVSGVWSLLIQLRGKRDSFKVGMDTISPEATPFTFLHVVSRSDHPIKISDYGFIEENGRLYSIPMEADLGEYIAHEGAFRGSSFLEKRGDAFEVGYDRTRPVIGCFAMTNLESRPTLAFRRVTPLWMRVWVRVKVWCKGDGYLA